MASVQRPVAISARLLRLDNPIHSLTAAFWLWKAVLIVVIAACPGLGYDTSTSLISDEPGAPTDIVSSLSVPLKFARWDSIYFLHTAETGYVFEQEWAFGYGYSKILALFISGVERSGGVGGPANIALAGVALSHVAHYLSVLAVYGLTANVFGCTTISQKLICFLSAALHIICPGGAFLSAPNPESIFSFLNITGFYLYSCSLIAGYNGKTLSRDSLLLTSAALFAVATTVRSNGILSGFLFAYDAAVLVWRTFSQGLSLHNTIRLGMVVLGGCIVALGTIVPQFLAWRVYCASATDPRPWCEWTVPSISAWVQGHYWNVGFLRYWTVSNLPLFLLAAPLIALLCRSSLWAMSASEHAHSPDHPGSMLVRLSIPQGLLAVLALTSYHVQIINRISSGYPLWYWYLVSGAVSSLSRPKANHRVLTTAVQGMVGYGLIQGVLFGSFLPPA
ncbi:hypothetical protein N7474_006869 [Penicillium riverlandense]|uniref:uncharacterized protein n=1 Tax=Penicillium riverlandense TaxID=1903569 RepID=UPI002546B403|nr:uncharacterized protein N7474_006869 [Penicillium riverlandense]KAJ5815092.1 hypothetical protein N7474_006869 [Penicillium riverlandense]